MPEYFPDSLEDADALTLFCVLFPGASRVGFGSGADAAAIGDAILQETGDLILQEQGGDILQEQ